MSIVKSYKDLIVWQKAMDLAVEVYRLSDKFPKAEIYSLTDQLRRATVSVVSNIAEGKGRESKQEYLHFLAIAQGSLTEAETQLLLAVRLGYLKDGDVEKALAISDEIGRMLNVMRTKLKNPSPLKPNP